jgi:predicted acylesterase/phospholipase RssA
MYATNINSSRLGKVDISYKSHPDLPLIKALRMTMAFPILFEPIFLEDGCYIDGGLLNNYPLNDCIEQQKCDTEEILGFKNNWNNHALNIDEKSTIFNFLFILLRKLQLTIDTEDEQIEVKYTIRCIIEDLARLDKWAETIKSEVLRKSIVEKGHAQADLFLASLSMTT